MKNINMFRASVLCVMLMACAATKAQTTDETGLRFEETSIGYWGFDGISNYGASWNRYGLRGSFGVDLNVRTNFKRFGNYNSDIGINYVYPLWGEGSKRLFFIGAAGPSLRVQKYPEVKYNSTTGKATEQTKSKLYFDIFANPRVMFMYNKFRVSAGVFFWSAECKFSSDYAKCGFTASIGYDL